jgi:hypothetical protein
MAGERHGRGMLCVNRPLDRAATGIGCVIYEGKTNYGLKGGTVRLVHSSHHSQQITEVGGKFYKVVRIHTL